MFKYFIGKVYILEKPPEEEKSQLDISIPDDLLGNVDINKYKESLTEDQYLNLSRHEKRMSELIGFEDYDKSRVLFQSSSSSTIMKIAVDLSENKDKWNGLSYLNSSNPEDWDRNLYNVLSLGGRWGFAYSVMVKFIKVLSLNWSLTIPEMLDLLKPFGIDIDSFFKIEREVSFKLSSLVSDLNLLQSFILDNGVCDVSKFSNQCAYVFLPKVVFQLEEYGLPRMISRKIQNSGLFDFERVGLSLDDAISFFNSYGRDRLIDSIQNINGFELYIIDYFYDGISEPVMKK